MEITGKIIAVLEVKKGTSARGNWTAQHFVLETQEKYPKRLLFVVFGQDNLDKYNIQENEIVKVFFEPEAKEVSGNWYASNRATNVTHEI